MDASRSVLVAGAGTMGRGIAELMALRGFEVQLWDLYPKQLGLASAAIERSLKRQTDIGRISDRDLDLTLGRIRLISDLRIVHPRTAYSLEAIIEDMGVKRDLLATIEVQLPDTLLATHTASLSITQLSEALRRPERLVGMHFFHPAAVMPLVEIVYSKRTDERCLSRAIDFAERALGKQTIVVQDSPGFAASRLGMSMALEAMRMVEQKVASIEDIDRAMEFGYRHPMGPLRQSDWIGLDVRLNVAQVLYRELNELAFKPPQILEELVAAGKLGRKTGEGFYKWPKE